MMLLVDDHVGEECSPVLLPDADRNPRGCFRGQIRAHRACVSVYLPLRRCRDLSRGIRTPSRMKLPREKARYVARLFMNPTSYRARRATDIDVGPLAFSDWLLVLFERKSALFFQRKGARRHWECLVRFGVKVMFD